MHLVTLIGITWSDKISTTRHIHKLPPPLLHPGRLTWNLQITHLKRKMIFQTSMIMEPMLIFRGVLLLLLLLPFFLVILTPRCSRFQGKTCQTWHRAHSWAEGNFLIQLLGTSFEFRSQDLIWDLCLYIAINICINIDVYMYTKTIIQYRNLDNVNVYLRFHVWLRSGSGKQNSLIHINVTPKNNGHFVIA